MAEETIGDPRFHISGTLLQQALNRIGSHPALDSALAYFVDSYSAFKTSDQFQINVARRGGVNAVGCLRDALSTQLDQHEEAVMVSMSIHIEAEVTITVLNVQLIILTLDSVFSGALCKYLDTPSFQRII